MKLRGCTICVAITKVLISCIKQVLSLDYSVDLSFLSLFSLQVLLIEFIPKISIFRPD